VAAGAYRHVILGHSSAARAATISTAAGIGSRLTLSFVPIPYAPFRLRWEAEISEFVWDEHFCDRQVRGPFSFWNHCHYVRGANQLGIDTTFIADDLEYEVPFGIAGQLAHRLFLRRQIERTFAYRQRQLARIFGDISSESQPQPGPQANPGAPKPR
jgi:ligand-binding SRPBCC domain-containing protein